MADMSYRCHHCGSIHEIESIRENLYVNQRSVASYALPWRRGRADFRGMARWLLARRIAMALWPRYPRGTRPL
jgi:hypothetical protein